MRLGDITVTLLSDTNNAFFSCLSMILVLEVESPNLFTFRTYVYTY